MKASTLMYSMFILAAMGFTAASCEDQSPEYEEVQLTDSCSLNLKRVETFNNVFGTITSTGDKMNPFVIEGNADSGWSASGPLLPCNLPAELEVDGLKIMFSGYLYEDPPYSVIGIPFEFTQQIRVRTEPDNTP